MLSGNCLFYYSHESDVRPKGVIFLTGSIIAKVKEEDMEFKGYYGFEMLHQDSSSSTAAHPSKKISLIDPNPNPNPTWGI